MDQDILNYKIELWRLEAFLDKCKVARINNKFPQHSLNATIESLEWAVNTLKVPPDFEQQLEKAQQEAEFANEELRQLKVDADWSPLLTCDTPHTTT